MASSRLHSYAILLAVAVVSRCLSWPISLIHVDEFAFILSAREVLAGNLPYTTFFDIKPVGTSAILAIVMAIFGQALLVIRIFGTACVIATGIALYEIVRLASHRRIEALSAGLLYISFSVLFSGLATMTEILLAPFSSLGMLLLCRILFRSFHQKLGAWTALSAGLAFGCSIWIKAVPIIPGAGLGTALLLAELFMKRSRFSAILVSGCLFYAGLMLPTALTASIYAARGEFGLFSYANFGFMHVYMQPDPLRAAIFHLIVIASEMWPLISIAAIGVMFDIGDALKGRRISFLAPAMYVWLGGELLASVAPLRLYEHYFLMTIPPLAVLAARAVTRVVMSVEDTNKSKKLLAGVVLLVVLVPVVPTVRSSAVSLFKYRDSQRSTSRIISASLPSANPSLLILSYDYMADYFFTHSALPGRVAIPVHLFGPQTDLISPNPVGVITELLNHNPQMILVDFTDLRSLASPAEEAAVRRKLSCCYRESAALPEFWNITGGGTYHIADVHLFQHRSSR